jgi:hypothetical protein
MEDIKSLTAILAAIGSLFAVSLIGGIAYIAKVRGAKN